MRRDPLEIEQLRHQLLVIGDRIDDLDHGLAEAGLAAPVEIDVRDVQDRISPICRVRR